MLSEVNSSSALSRLTFSFRVSLGKQHLFRKEKIKRINQIRKARIVRQLLSFFNNFISKKQWMQKIIKKKEKHSQNNALVSKTNDRGSEMKSFHLLTRLVFYLSAPAGVRVRALGL